VTGGGAAGVEVRVSVASVLVFVAVPVLIAGGVLALV
jgi:hypothetical protein